jgi:hypothetical protein
MDANEETLRTDDGVFTRGDATTSTAVLVFSAIASSFSFVGVDIVADGRTKRLVTMIDATGAS